MFCGPAAKKRLCQDSTFAMLSPLEDKAFYASLHSMRRTV